jgi:hypothetical protein
VSFLAPLFLLGAAAIALPVIFHLIRRTTRERTPFSSLMFLNPSPPRLTRRSRLEHLLLLALRCLVLVLLAAGFARPFFRKQVAGNDSAIGSRRRIVMVDASASMKRAGLWPEALRKADAALSSASPVDQVAVYTFDRQLHPLMTFDQWNGLTPGERASRALQSLKQTSPGWAATRLGDSLISAAEILADATTKTVTSAGEIVVITDLQEGSHPEQLQGYDWPKNISVQIQPVKASSQGNASLHLVTETDAADTAAAPGVRVRVSNSAGSRYEKFKLGWATADGRGFEGKAMDVYVPAGQSRMVNLARGGEDTLKGGQQTAANEGNTVKGGHRTDARNKEGPKGIESQTITGREANPKPGSGAAGVNASTGQKLEIVLLQGDDEDFDNRVYVAASAPTQARIAYFGSEDIRDAHGALYFVDRAFQGTRKQTMKLTISAQDKPAPSAELQAANLLIGAGKLGDKEAASIAELVHSGKTLLFALAGEADAAALGRIINRSPVTLSEARVSNYAMLSEIDFRHPLFSAFADPRFSDFTKIHFWKYRVIKPADLPSNARILAKFDAGDPAIVEIPVAAGRVILFASTWRPADSQLALSTKFVPLLYSLLEQSSGPAPAPTQYYIGDPIPVASAAAEANREWTLNGPDGSRLKLAAGETNFFGAMSPGIYTLNSGEKTTRFAVNVDPLESRTAPLASDEFEKLGVPMAQLTDSNVQTRRQAQLQNTELENRQKLWRWLLLGTIGVLLIETWLAGRTSRALAVQGGSAA